jgi:hypothetical protein
VKVTLPRRRGTTRSCLSPSELGLLSPGFFPHLDRDKRNGREVALRLCEFQAFVSGYMTESVVQGPGDALTIEDTDGHLRDFRVAGRRTTLVQGEPIGSVIVGIDLEPA